MQPNPQPPKTAPSSWSGMYPYAIALAASGAAFWMYNRCCDLHTRNEQLYMANNELICRLQDQEDQKDTPTQPVVHPMANQDSNLPQPVTHQEVDWVQRADATNDPLELQSMARQSVDMNRIFGGRADEVDPETMAKLEALAAQAAQKRAAETETGGKQ